MVDEGKKQLQELYSEIGVNCPIRAARFLGIRIKYNDDLENVIGMYQPVLNKRQIVLNSTMDHDTQDMACLMLLQHHLVNDGLALAVNVEDLTAAEDPVKKRKRQIEELKLQSRFTWFRLQTTSR